MLLFLEKIQDGRKDDGSRAMEMPSERLQLEPPAVLSKNTNVLDVRESLGLVPATARARNSTVQRRSDSAHRQQRTQDGDPTR